MELTITVHVPEIEEQAAEQLADLLYNATKHKPNLVYSAHTNHTLYPQEAD